MSEVVHTDHHDDHDHGPERAFCVGYIRPTIKI